jgi:IS1 family transposase
LNDCKEGDTDDSSSYDNSLLGLNRNKVGIITSDGNWSYHKLINCNQRKIVKIKKDKKGKFLRDEKDNLIKETKEKEYKNDNILLDCDKHIIDKAKTCLVETINGSLRGRFARFNRRTKSCSKSYEGLCNAVLLWVKGHVNRK